MDKRSIRRENFRRIKALPDDAKVEESTAIARHLSSAEIFKKAQTIFSFAAMPSEPDLSTLRSSFPEKTWGLSRVADDGEALHFHQIDEGQDLMESDFGFEEPDPDTCPLLYQPDLILIPGVGFDPETGARLGRGKGHYDRYLAPLVNSDRPPLLVGVSFRTQWVPLFPEPHDIPMNYLITGEGIQQPAT